MNNFTREALYKEVFEFSKDDDSEAGRAAKELADALAEKLNQTKFNSDDFSEDCISFLCVKSDKLNSLDKKIISNFIERCQKYKAVELVERLVDIYTAPYFNISLVMLSFFGEQFANAGFNADSARCFKKATKMVQSEAEQEESNDD